MVDLHSFPSRLVADQGDYAVQVCLGDDGGQTNPGWLTGAVRHAFVHAGMSVSRDDPFRGGYIVKHYGAMPRVNALFVGLRRDLYLDEHRADRTPTHAGFRALQNVLSDVFTGLIAQINAGAMRMSSVSRLGVRLAI